MAIATWRAALPSMTGERIPSGVGVVVIGRNEGERLKTCLRSLVGVEPVIYVDSGSTDGSRDYARAMGATVVDLPSSLPFTAARARNAGLGSLLDAAPATALVQMVDGDCEVAGDWLDRAATVLDGDAALAGVFGRRRERFPERSLYNRVTDDEWNVQIGPALSTGGDAMFRVAALREVGGYTDALIAGEEPDMCLRLRRRGWRFERLDAEMTLHDAAILRFGQWWRRSVRSGYACAEHLARHGTGSIPEMRRQRKRVIAWAGLLPVLIVAALLCRGAGAGAAGWAALVLLAVYPAQVGRLAWRDRRRWPSMRIAIGAAALSVIGKFSMAEGMLRFRRDRARGGSSGIIEYKKAAG